MAKEYNISKPAGQCGACGRELAPGDEYVATVREASEEFLREDFCPPCWQERADQDPGDLLGHWRGRVPQPEEKTKRRFVDDELLIRFFDRLEDADQSAKINFRFVLALVLMRKKRLVYDRSDKRDDGQEVWTLHFRGSDQARQVINPRMDDDTIAEASGHLGQILEGEL